MKKALVLAGGGTRGIYQLGVLKALHELGEDDFNMVFGVSVGALNAAMIVQGDLDRMAYMYDHLEASQIVKGFVPNDMSIGNLINERQEFILALKYWASNGGIDISPFYQMVHDFYVPERFFASSKDFFCVTATAKNHEGVLVTKDMMKEHGEDWLVASASAYPAFPIKTIDGNEYVDGGYYDNFPVDYALQQGADKIIGIDMGPDPIHPLYLEKDDIWYIHPREEMYNFLTFDHVLMQKAKLMGYNDTMKTYGRLEGWKYTFVPFAYPSYFDEYYRGLLRLETKIKMATSLNERFRSQQVITDILQERMHLSHLSVRQYYYGILDALLELSGADSSKIYTLEEAKKIILASFAQCAYEDYAYKPLGIINLAPYIKGLDQKGYVEKIIHANLYPDHRLFSDETLMTLHPFEVALADFVTIMMKHLPEDSYAENR
jgi:Predicted esterase of the alpha-beta hydrolase superfamily